MGDGRQGWGMCGSKNQKLLKTPGTVPIVAKLCMIDCKNKISPGKWKWKWPDFEYHVGK